MAHFLRHTRGITTRMSEYDALMLQSLRAEITFFNVQIFCMVVLVTIVTVALYVLAHRGSFHHCAQLIPFVLASGLFGIGRADLLMHRAGAYVRQLEARSPAGMGWEAFKAGQSATALLPLYDIPSLTLWSYLLIWSEREAWRQRAHPGRLWFALARLILIGLGALSIAYGATTG
jgi:hypothetical protein